MVEFGLRYALDAAREYLQDPYHQIMVSYGISIGLSVALAINSFIRLVHSCRLRRQHQREEQAKAQTLTKIDE